MWKLEQEFKKRKNDFDLHFVNIVDGPLEIAYKCLY